MPAATNPQSLPQHAHGVPNWIDLQTSHTDKARIFYDALLGWTFRNRFTLAAVPSPEESAGRPPRPDAMPAALVARRCGEPVAELIERTTSSEPLDVPANWSPYVHVTNLEATLDLVEPAGGLVLSPPAPRADLARVATILDPSDALLCLWEPVTSVGSTSLHRPGTLTWIELETTDLDRACKFYGQLFDWDAGQVDSPAHPGGYTVFTRNGDRVAGATESPLADLAASWCPSFAVPDVDAATDAAVANGGVVMFEPADMAVGRQSVLVDPVGAVFALLGPVPRGPRPL